MPSLGALRRGAIWIAACALIGLLCAPVRADDAYESLVSQALRAHAAGEFEQAHALFAQAHALVPNARTLRGMGVASYQAGDVVRAVGELEAALAHAEKPLEGELRAAAQGLLERARARVGTLELHVVPSSAHVQVDAETEQRPVDAPLVLAPGAHRLRFRAEGQLEQLLELNVAAGARHVLSVRLVPAPRAAARAATLPAPRPVERAPTPQPPRWPVRAAWSTLGVAMGAGIVAGALFLGAQARVGRIADACRATAMQQCTPEERDTQLSRARIEGLERGMNVALGVAGAALVVGAGALIAWRVRKGAAHGEAGSRHRSAF